MSGWTKGPWLLEGTAIVDACGYYVATTSAHGKSEDRQRENARLIAASPTMATYIEKKANEGDEDAARILAIITGNT